MARIRTVKPEFWTSEQVISCSPLARLLFIGLFNFSDDHGVHPASYVRIKAEVFPADNFSLDEVKRWVGELITNDLVREYAVENKSYWIITGWDRHQRIDRPTYRHPLPLSGLKQIVEVSSSIQRELNDNSTINSGIVTDYSPTEWKGMEGKGMEEIICEVETSPSYELNQSTANKVQKVFKYWQDVMNHPNAKLDAKRKRKIEQALQNYSVEQLKLAIDGCSKTSFNMGHNDQNKRFDCISLITRDSSHIERFIQNASTIQNKITQPINTDLFAGAI